MPEGGKMIQRIAIVVICVLASAEQSWAGFDISRRGALSSPPDPSIEQTYSGTEPGRTAASSVGPTIHAYGDGASGDAWATSSSYYYRPFPNSGGSNGQAVWSDDFIIDGAGLAGEAGVLRASVGLSTRVYGGLNNIVEVRSGAALSSAEDFDNALTGRGNQLGGSEQVFDLELSFIFGQPIAVVLSADSHVDGSANSGGWAAASWRGITDVLDSGGNSLTNSGSSLRFSSLDTLSVTSSSGFDYTQTAANFEVVVVPEPTIAIAGVVAALFLCRRSTAKRRA